ncbi:MAG: hypothetical protein AAF771_15160 [Pseudomonadota bacterium]
MIDFFTKRWRAAREINIAGQPKLSKNVPCSERPDKKGNLPEVFPSQPVEPYASGIFVWKTPKNINGMPLSFTGIVLCEPRKEALPPARGSNERVYCLSRNSGFAIEQYLLRYV